MVSFLDSFRPKIFFTTTWLGYRKKKPPEKGVFWGLLRDKQVELVYI